VKYDKNTGIDIKRAAWSSLSHESQKAYQSDFDLFFKFVKKDPLYNHYGHLKILKNHLKYQK
jgi:hypothetical protein